MDVKLCGWDQVHWQLSPYLRITLGFDHLKPPMGRQLDVLELQEIKRFPRSVWVRSMAEMVWVSGVFKALERGSLRLLGNQRWKACGSQKRRRYRVNRIWACEWS